MVLRLDWRNMPGTSDEFRDETQRYVSRLDEVFRDRLAGVLCFGSVARGSANPGRSDIDLIALVEELPPLRDRVLLRMDFAWDFPTRVECVWMTPVELDGHVRAKAGYILDALDEGVALYDPRGIIAATTAAMREELARKGVVKTARWWSFPARLGERVELG
jgi:predicted nucleotidyltransferase